MARTLYKHYMRIERNEEFKERRIKGEGVYKRVNDRAFIFGTTQKSEVYFISLLVIN